MENSVKSAYEHIEDFSKYIFVWKWNCIWKLNVIPRVQMFCLLMVYDRLLTNVKRTKRGSSCDSLCKICKQKDEDVIHVLRDCMVAKGNWLSLCVLHMNADFFKYNCQEWFYDNLKNKGTCRAYLIAKEFSGVISLELVVGFYGNGNVNLLLILFVP